MARRDGNKVTQLLDFEQPRYLRFLQYHRRWKSYFALVSLNRNDNGLKVYDEEFELRNSLSVGAQAPLAVRPVPWAEELVVCGSAGAQLWNFTREDGAGAFGKASYMCSLKSTLVLPPSLKEAKLWGAYAMHAGPPRGGTGKEEGKGKGGWEGSMRCIVSTTGVSGVSDYALCAEQ